MLWVRYNIGYWSTDLGQRYGMNRYDLDSQIKNPRCMLIRACTLGLWFLDLPLVIPPAMPFNMAFVFMRARWRRSSNFLLNWSKLRAPCRPANETQTSKVHQIETNVGSLSCHNQYSMSHLDQRALQSFIPCQHLRPSSWWNHLFNVFSPPDLWAHSTEVAEWVVD